MTSVRTALVIGGGIAGPATAMALKKAGIDATVYEAYDSTADGLGGALSIAPNGLAALEIIGAAQRVRDAGVRTDRMVIQSHTGRRLATFSTLPGVPTTYTVNRSDLYRALLDEAKRQDVLVVPGKTLVDLAQTTDDVTAHFADGGTATGDIMVGADGIRSTVRGLIDPAAPQPRYVRLLGMGGWVRAADLTSTGGAMHFVFGKRAFFGYQVLDDGLAGWFANLPHAEPMSGAQARAVPAAEWLDRMRQLFADDNSPALRILDHMDPAELVNVGGMEDLPSVPTWHRGRTVLVGDAAHATSPSSGQGASMAIESGIQLARSLRDMTTVDAAFTSYERLRRTRVERVIAAGARVNNDKAAGPVGRVIRDLMVPLAIRTFYNAEKAFGWQHRYRIDWDAPVAAESAAPQPA
ncbi:MAG: FAD-dependent monooxygenase [Micromonosporaceae bacterium]